MRYGINWFFLAKSRVLGKVIQENLLTNLSYHYDITNYPLYAVAQSIVDYNSGNNSFILDVGIDPNFIKTSYYEESSLNGISQPDILFPGHMSTTFSVTVGAGFRLNQEITKIPLTCGYRFFYLGEGRFNNVSNQLNTFKTGSTYANALLCSVTI